MDFDWDPKKDIANQIKHGLSFAIAQLAFSDPKRIITRDLKHGHEDEQRFFCLGRVEGEILTVRFTWRNGVIRIFGAGFWREGKKRYEKENRL
jgi:uncharacterized protein